MKKWSKIIMLAFFVGISSQIRLTVLTDGFIVALSVLIMSVFIFCFEDIKPRHLIFTCGIISPFMRFIRECSNMEFNNAVITIIPDAVFFFTYGIIYTFIYNRVLKKPKSIVNFPFVIMFCDSVSNVAELLVRSILSHKTILNLESLGIIIAIAVIRTFIIHMIVFSIEVYSDVLVAHEMDKEFRKLVLNAAKLEGEVHIMEKNISEMEYITKKAYDLYKTLDQQTGVFPELKKTSLDIARLTHEVKGDYMGVVDMLKTQFIYDIKKNGMEMSDIMNIKVKDFEAQMRNGNYDVPISVKIKSNFYVRPYFEMISVMRNLTTNSVEAFENKQGKIKIYIYEDRDFYIIEHHDNGPGISEDIIGDIFVDGYSTKFDEETGNIQRGLGLALVKDYVEKIFGGSIFVKSELGKYTLITIKIPKEIVRSWEVRCNEVLSD